MVSSTPSMTRPSMACEQILRMLPPSVPPSTGIPVSPPITSKTLRTLSWLIPINTIPPSVRLSLTPRRRLSKDRYELVYNVAKSLANSFKKDSIIAFDEQGVGCTSLYFLPIIPISSETPEIIQSITRSINPTLIIKTSAKDSAGTQPRIWCEFFSRITQLSHPC